QVSVCGDQPASDGRVDICLLDARTRSVRGDAGSRDGRPYLIVVNAPDDDEWAVDMLGIGVRGILSRDSSGEDLIKAIHVVHEGGLWARRRWLDACVHRAAASRRPLDRQSSFRLDGRLSNREREVFRHAATGAGNKELATLLSISEATVKAHLTRIFQKLGVSGRAELAAAYHGLRPVAAPQVVRRSA
ncbi:MAG TPA: response regulator transcription factor, partial [Vicinamibacterales bacterium]|nr:response regulator transcription factor [Vicinamibacterales bacterium]